LTITNDKQKVKIYARTVEIIAHLVSSLLITNKSGRAGLRVQRNKFTETLINVMKSML
jgi:hypothetical protein